MNSYQMATSCLPDLQEERAHLSTLLPLRVLEAREDRSDRCALLAWAQSGLMHLTGHACGPPLAPGAPVLSRAALIAAAIQELTQRRPVSIDLSHVLTFRAARMGLMRAGTVSAGSTCRLLRAADGWLAVNLARPDDVASVPAILGRDLREDPWDELSAEAVCRPAASLSAAAQTLGVPAAVLGGAEGTAPITMSQLGHAGQAPLVVLDLSAMWAGPLCAHILGSAGWEIIKVEDVNRPDGARSGDKKFYGELHANARTVVLDFATSEGRGELARIAGRAGVVIESSRPRALRRLGLVAEEWLATAPGRIWVSVTGYGREDPGQRVAFGDDAAVAGGLVAHALDGTPTFCGDAIADPFSGLYAALAALAAHATGGGWLADVAMAGVCGDLTRPTRAPCRQHLVGQRPGYWEVVHEQSTERVAIP